MPASLRWLAADVLPELSARLPGGPIPDDRYPPKERRPIYLSEWERLRRATT